MHLWLVFRLFYAGIFFTEFARYKYYILTVKNEIVTKVVIQKAFNLCLIRT